MSSYSVSIQTFVHRFDKYFKPLIDTISSMRPDIDKVVFVNGQHNEKFNQKYRQDILTFLSSYPNTYVIMSPIWRGCSHMWNTCFNYTDTDYILNMNDDVTVIDGFFDDYEAMVRYNDSIGSESFRINFSFSHFSVYRKDLFDVGYFDERFIGIGEEDGDWVWRWEAKKQTHLRCYTTNKILNHIDPENVCVNMNIANKKYSAFNAEWIREKYDIDGNNFDKSKPIATGMFGKPVQPKIETPNFYPAEKWYRENRKKL